MYVDGYTWVLCMCIRVCLEWMCGVCTCVLGVYVCTRDVYGFICTCECVCMGTLYTYVRSKYVRPRIGPANVDNTLTCVKATSVPRTPNKNLGSGGWRSTKDCQLSTTYGNHDSSPLRPTTANRIEKEVNWFVRFS